MFLFVNANAYETSISVAQGSDDQRVVERLQEEFSGLSTERFPNFVRLLPLSMTGSREQRFNFGLQLMITGLLHTEPPETS